MSVEDKTMNLEGQKMKIEFQKIFEGDGKTFSAKNEAEKWLKDNGYSYGSSCVMAPQGIVKGDVYIAKWRNMTWEEQGMVDGKLFSDREGTARIVLKHIPDIVKNTIPEMVNPLGKHWDQPSREDIEIDNTHALMAEFNFRRLSEYSRSQPSGVYEGKMWKCEFLDSNRNHECWVLRWYVDIPGNMCKTEQRIILI